MTESLFLPGDREARLREVLQNGEDLARQRPPTAQQPTRNMRAILSADLVAGGNADAAIYDKNGNATGESYTVEGTWCIPAGHKLESGTEVLLIPVGDVLEVACSMDCVVPV